MKNKTLIFNNSLYNNISYGNLKKKKKKFNFYFISFIEKKLIRKIKRNFDKID